ncbi:MAG: inositol monophosphatase family protein [Bacillota bacterium]
MNRDLKIKKVLAVEAAREAGNLLCKFRKDLRIEEKGKWNWVTNADRESERLITQLIKSFFPDDFIFGEEGAARGVEALQSLDQLWIVDPLDGTNNYVQGFNYFGVSIAYWDKGIPMLGVVFVPAMNELFVAARGEGAFYNHEQVNVSGRNDFNEAFIGTGIPYEPDSDGNINNDHVGNFLLKTHNLRCMGAAALDLAYVASGRLDGFWEYGLAPWDVAAGILLVEEAGGTVTNFIGGPVDIFSGKIVASNKLIHSKMLEVLSLGKTGMGNA